MVNRAYASGASTNSVVQGVVRDGHDRDYEIVFLEDCCSAMSHSEHACAVDGLKRYCTVTTSTEVEFK